MHHGLLGSLVIVTGGGRGIRTPGTVPRTVVFKTTRFNRSRIPPRYEQHSILRYGRTATTNVYFSGVTVSTISRSRGPSNSTRTTRCQVPSTRLFFSKGKAIDVPTRADRM